MNCVCSLLPCIYRSKPGESLAFILKLLKDIADTYFKRGKASDFIISLLKLSTPWLFSESQQQQQSVLPVVKATASPNTRSGFVAFLTGYIRMHSLIPVLQRDIDTIWVSRTIRTTGVEMYGFTGCCISLQVGAHIRGLHVIVRPCLPGLIGNTLINKQHQIAKQRSY